MNHEYNLRYDGDGWSVYGPFNGYPYDFIASGETLEEAMRNAYELTRVELTVQLRKTYE